MPAGESWLSDGWLPDAASALRYLAQRVGHVTADHVDAVLPPGSGEQERAELLSALAVSGVYVVGVESDLAPAAALSISGLYHRDMRLRPLLDRRGEQVLCSRLRRGDRWVQSAVSRTVAGALAAAVIARQVVTGQRSFDEVFVCGRDIGGRPGVVRSLSALRIPLRRLSSWSATSGLAGVAVDSTASRGARALPWPAGFAGCA